MGVALRFGIRALDLAEVWPALVDVSARQLANNEHRDAVTDSAPTWVAWTHAAGEEMAFRVPVVVAAVWVFGAATGTRMAGVSRKQWVVLASVVIATTLLFGLVHLEFSWLNVVAAWIMGAVCAALALLTRSIWPAVALHAAYNTPNLIAALSYLW